MPMQSLPQSDGESDVSYGGILAGLTDPELMAKIAERNRLVARIAEQMGVTREEAREHLFYFESCTSSDGQALN